MVKILLESESYGILFTNNCDIYKLRELDN